MIETSFTSINKRVLFTPFIGRKELSVLSELYGKRYLIFEISSKITLAPESRVDIPMCYSSLSLNLLIRASQIYFAWMELSDDTIVVFCGKERLLLFLCSICFVFHKGKGSYIDCLMEFQNNFTLDKTIKTYGEYIDKLIFKKGKIDQYMFLVKKITIVGIGLNKIGIESEWSTIINYKSSDVRKEETYEGDRTVRRSSSDVIKDDIKQSNRDMENQVKSTFTVDTPINGECSIFFECKKGSHQHKFNTTFLTGDEYKTDLIVHGKEVTLTLDIKAIIDGKYSPIRYENIFSTGKKFLSSLETFRTYFPGPIVKQKEDLKMEKTIKGIDNLSIKKKIPPPPPIGPKKTLNKKWLRQGVDWNEIKSVGLKSVWNYIGKDSVTQFNTEKLESLFCTTAEIKTNNKKEIILTGDINAINNISILLSRFRKEYGDITCLFDAIKKDLIDEDGLCCLIEAFRLAQGVKGELSVSDNKLDGGLFISELKKSVDISIICEIKYLKMKFNTESKIFVKDINTVIEGLKNIQESVELRKFLKSALDLCILCRSRYTRVAQPRRMHGIRLSDIIKMKSTRSTTGDTTLFDYLIEEGGFRIGKLRKSVEELCKKDLRNMSENITIIQGYLDKIKAYNRLETRLFVEENNDEMKRIETMKCYLDVVWEETQEYFGDCTISSPESLFTVLNSILKEI
eukprot:GHVP01057465.1.p1 GENE.GHVP01057465.1~~GHVP01057465.1.p1  ORF type:complete len:684 (-),score=112.05 GHVP01057465.1:33-2084(-)